MSISTLDKKDQQILGLLQEDARISNAELAERIGLAASSCLRRVKELEKEGWIRAIQARLNREILQLRGTAMIFVTLERQSQTQFKTFEAAVQQLPYVQECLLIAGSADYLLKVVFADARHFEHLYYEHILRLPGVMNTQTHMALRTVLERSELPLEARRP